MNPLTERKTHVTFPEDNCIVKLSKSHVFWEGKLFFIVERIRFSENEP